MWELEKVGQDVDLSNLKEKLNFVEFMGIQRIVECILTELEYSFDYEVAPISGSHHGEHDALWVVGGSIPVFDSQTEKTYKIQAFLLRGDEQVLAYCQEDNDNEEIYAYFWVE